MKPHLGSLHSRMKKIFFVINNIMESYEEYDSQEDENTSREIIFPIPKNRNQRLRKAITMSNILLFDASRMGSFPGSHRENAN